MKKKMSILALILQSCAVLFLFIPIVWKESFMHFELMRTSFYTVGSHTENYFGALYEGIGFIGILTCFVGFCSAVVLAMYYLNTAKSKPFQEKLLFLPALSTVLLVISVIVRLSTVDYIHNSYHGGGSLTLGAHEIPFDVAMDGFGVFQITWFMVFIIVIQISATVLSILLAKHFWADSPAPRDSTI